MIRPTIGVKIVFDNTGKLAGALRQNAARIVAKAAFDIEARAKLTVPVDTGALKNSIRARQGRSDLEWIVEVGQEYGVYIEYGTVHMGARPYLAPAAQAINPSFQTAFKKVLG